MENTPNYVKEIYNSNLNLWNSNEENFENNLTKKCSNVRNRLKNFLSPNPEISVVIPARNEEKYILMTLESLANQVTSKKFEIIVVINNNSNDDITPKICEMCGVKIINYNFYSKKHKPISLARQLGLIQSQGKLIFSTDADAILMPQWIENLSNVLNSDPDVGYATSLSYLYFWEDDEKVKANNYGRNNMRKISNHLGASGMGGNMAFRRDYAEKRGGWNTKVYPSEDTEMSIRLTKLKGRKAIMLDDKKSHAWFSPRRVKEYGTNSFILDFFTSYSKIDGEHINVR